jgi:hypothetical protein
MKAWIAALLGCAAIAALAVPRATTPAPATAQPAAAAAPRAAPQTSQVTVAHGFAEIGTAFRRGAGSAKSSPDRLARSEAEAAAQADDAAATRADTVPASAPRER